MSQTLFNIHLIIRVVVNAVGECHGDVTKCFFFQLKAQEDAAAQIQRMFSFITEEEETGAEAGGLVKIFRATGRIMVDSFIAILHYHMG